MDSNVEGDCGRFMIEGGRLARCVSQSSLDECSQRARCGGPPEDHAVAVLGGLCRLRREGGLTDVCLVAATSSEEHSVPALTSDEHSVPAHTSEHSVPAHTSEHSVLAHRAVLAAASPYFRAMFTQFDERTQDTVTIQNIEPQALEAIVDYIYSPESLSITEENVQSLLSGSSLVQVWGVINACCSFLAAALAPDNVLGIRAFAELHSCTELATAAQRYLERHFLDVAQHDEFVGLSVTDVCGVLGAERLCLGELGERAVMDAALRWARGGDKNDHPDGDRPDPVDRTDHLAAVLSHVRLPLVPHEALLTAAAEDPLRNAAAPVKDLIIEALAYHLMQGDARQAVAANCIRARPRAPPDAPRALLVVGGQAPKAVRDVEAYDLDRGRWSSLGELPGRRCRAGLAAVGGKVWLVGGFNGTLRVRCVDIYNPVTDTWSSGPPLSARRSTLGVGVVGTVIYAVGGFDGTQGLHSAERLDTALNDPRWGHIADMATRRSSVGVGTLNGLVYAVGGYDGASRQCLSSVERYDPAQDRWTTVGEMAARRSGCGVAALGGALYALGGHDGPAVRRSVERYNPLTGTWSVVPPMLHARRNAAVAVWGGRLFVVGGDDGQTNLDSVEVFDPATGIWSEVSGGMCVGRSYAGVAVVQGGT